jgi:hypothetical protein
MSLSEAWLTKEPIDLSVYYYGDTWKAEIGPVAFTFTSMVKGVQTELTTRSKGFSFTSRTSREEAIQGVTRLFTSFMLQPFVAMS